MPGAPPKPAGARSRSLQVSEQRELRVVVLGETVKVAEKLLPAQPILARIANAQPEAAWIKALCLNPFLAEEAEHADFGFGHNAQRN